MKQIRKRLTYANVMSSIAVFLVLGGGAALAAGKLGKNTVGSKQLKKSAVTTAKIKDGSVTGAKVEVSTLPTVPSATMAAKAATATSAETAAKATTATNANTAISATTAATAANATKLGGLAASDLVRATTATETVSIEEFNASTYLALISKQVTAPVNGILMIWAQVDVNKDSHSANPVAMNLRGAVDGQEATATANVLSAEVGITDKTGTVSGAIPVTAGTHTVSLEGRVLNPADLGFLTDRSITTLFVPFGNAGVQGNLGS